MRYRTTLNPIDLQLLQLAWKREGSRLILEGLSKAKARNLIKKPEIYERLQLLVRKAGAEVAQIRCPGQKNGFPVFAAALDDEWDEAVRPVETNYRSIMTSSSEPIIATPSAEIGSITLTRQVSDRLIWMLNNPQEVSGITRVYDEAQVIMSASSVALLTTTTLKQAVQRKRSEFWHPNDLMDFRILTGEFVRDLRNGVINPEQTRRDVSWRCVSGNGRWRLITHQYETFIDENGIAYQLSKNLGVEAIETPTDLVLA